jgi:hypothetical protein
MFGFLQRRLQENEKAWAKLTSGTRPNEWLECQQQFVQRTVADYVEEAGMLSRMMMESASASFGSAPPRRDETAQAKPVHHAAA